jgi:hypothetical protein
MTYWPFASPSVFAATKHNPTDRVQLSHDRVEPIRADVPNGAPEEGTSKRSSTEPGEREKVHEAPLDTAIENEKGHVHRDSASQQDASHLAEDDVAGEIISIKVTRGGHMFATVTRTTLTIWQTKARYSCDYMTLC